MAFKCPFPSGCEHILDEEGFCQVHGNSKAWKDSLMQILKKLQEEEMQNAEEMSAGELGHYIDRYLNFVEW